MERDEGRKTNEYFKMGQTKERRDDWSRSGSRSREYDRYDRDKDAFSGNRSTMYGSADSYAENIGNSADSTERSGFFGKGPKGYKRSDEKIKEEVSEALYRDQRIDATEIEVSVNDGLVCLRGTVDTRAAKRAAEECVDRIAGVEDVQNELRLRRETGTSLHPNSTIAGRNTSPDSSKTSLS